MKDGTRLRGLKADLKTRLQTASRTLSPGIPGVPMKPAAPTSPCTRKHTQNTLTTLNVQTNHALKTRYKEGIKLSLRTTV